MPELYFYALKQISESGKTYYRDFINYEWVEDIDVHCLLNKEWQAKQMGEKYSPDNYTIVKFELKEIGEL